MENTNTNQNHATPPTVEENGKTDAFKQDLDRVKALIQKIKDGIKEKRELAKKAHEQQLAEQEDAQEKPKNIFTSNKLVIVALGVFLFFTVLLVAASLYRSLAGRKTATTTLPTPTPVAEVEVDTQITTFSRYATDSAVVDMETKTNDLDKQMSAGVGELQLSLPNLDFDVSF